METPSTLTQERPTILVVDDTPDNLTFISGLLKEHYRVKVANNGEKALTIARSDNPPSLILLDIMMPGMDGYEVCTHLKTDPKTAKIPVIFLTAKAETADEQKGLSLGAVDYITKPISPPILMARVKTHLQLKASYDELQELLAFREDMVNMVVHDLRNPLSTILLLTEMLIKYGQTAPEKQAQKLKMILENSHRLRLLIDDILIRSKLESGKLELNLQPTNIIELCRKTVKDIEEVAGRKNLTLVLTVPPVEELAVIADPMFLRRAVDNLLANAIKFAPSDSEIIVTLTDGKTEAVTVTVADQGPGVSEELRQRIFEKYEIGTLMKGVSQTGLGLAFCKIVMEAHGGTITVENHQPRGSIFTLTLPKSR
ncbi:MAG: hybrid sensor histidine kinase/response regulator [Merismopediaceae bacterium]|nr:hybrid sensor histidine kinase/response regulator [Merismopediaceae bacterium]